MGKRSKRYEVLAGRPVNQDGFVAEWPEAGLIAMNSPMDPKPSLRIENGRVMEMDGKCREDFDMIEQFLADHFIDVNVAHTIPQFMAGTDFIFSGYSAVPNYDNMFVGSNFDVEDVDDYLAMQRDFMVDGGLRSVSEEDVVAVRNRAARALQAVFKELGLPEITEEEVEAATYANGSKDMPPRRVPEDLKAAQDLLARGATGLDVVKALSKHGFTDIAQNVLNMLNQRVSGDYLHTSSILDKDFNVISAVNDPNQYQGPGTGYCLSPERWEEIKNITRALRPEDMEV